MTDDSPFGSHVPFASEVANAISLETGLHFSAESRDSDGFHGWAVRYVAQVEEGYAFDLLLAIGYRSSEVTLRPGRFSGPLVRAFSAAIAEDAASWDRQLNLASDQGVAVSVVADNEVLPNPSSLARLEFRQVEIECVAKSLGRSREDRFDATLKAARSAVSLLLIGLELQNDADVEEDLVEGSSVRVEVNKYERNPVARMQCIAHYGNRCWVCDLSFGEVYGSLGSGYIHVHHRVMVSTYGGTEYVVDPIRDLVPLCPNCHMMLHRKKPPLEPADLRSVMGKPEKPALPEIPS